jgi:hypothetical protein
MRLYFAGHPAVFGPQVLPLIDNHLTTFASPEEIKLKLKNAVMTRIHLADASRERGQCQALVDTGKTEHLLSYAYRNNSDFSLTWEKQTKEKRSGVLQVNLEKLPRILIDSGAFTAFTTGKVIRVEDYGGWALAFKKKWEPLVRSLHFFNLDVVGDEVASDKNLKQLEAMGLRPVPIFTYNGSIQYLKQYLKDYDYLALGGLVGRSTKGQDAWVEYCFKFVVQRYKETGVMPRVHLLGVTKQQLLEKYPTYSCDSSSWVKCLRFGGGDAIGKKKIPRYKESEEALKITVATLRAEIRKYQAMERDVTRLWNSRGVVWED